MKKTLLLSLSIFVSVVFSACEKVIDVKLNDSTPLIVIEGEVNTIRGPYTVTVTQSKNFDENNTFEGRTDAQVSIQDLSTNVIEVLSNRGGGAYQTSLMQGVLGHSYKLTVIVDGKTYTATSTIPAKAVRIERVYAKRFALDSEDIFMVPQFKDPAGRGNYYRIKQWVNGTQIKGSYVRSDEAADGFTYESQLFYSTDEEDGNPLIKQGDRMTAELQSVDKAVYDYFRTLNTTIEQDASTPSNPLSNISGGALGVFNACYSHTLTSIAKY